MVPAHRIQQINSACFNSAGRFILYWMISSRRTQDNFALEYALLLSEKHQKPLLVLEALRSDYLHSSDRFHRFIIEGMSDNQEAFEQSGVYYYPYVEEKTGKGKGLLQALSTQACTVITDYYPCFFLPSMVQKAAKQCPVSMFWVDANGILPLFETQRTFTTAASFRRHVQKTILSYLSEFPTAKPLQEYQTIPLQTLPKEIEAQWEKADLKNLLKPDGLIDLPIDHSVLPISIRGGENQAFKMLDSFLQQNFHRYHTARNQTDENACSGLSPYLHFGHISTHRIVQNIFEREKYTPPAVAPKATGSREGWWGLSEFAEAFLDQIITWRELGFVFNHQNLDRYDQYSSLPDWAQKTLDEHRTDPREYIYSLDDLEQSKTHDPIWNAAQNQLREEGIIHNYLRMLWGKKLLEWTETPEQALEYLLILNNKYSIDGRDPNSYSGIFWILGRFDRAWGPERSIFGKIRYMSSDSTARKIKLKNYLSYYNPAAH